MIYLNHTEVDCIHHSSHLTFNLYIFILDLYILSHFSYLSVCLSREMKSNQYCYQVNRHKTAQPSVIPVFSIAQHSVVIIIRVSVHIWTYSSAWNNVLLWCMPSICPHPHLASCSSQQVLHQLEFAALHSLEMLLLVLPYYQRWSILPEPIPRLLHVICQLW